MKKIFLLALLLLLLPLTASAAPKADLWPVWQSHDPHSAIAVDHSAWGEFLRNYLETKHTSTAYRVNYAQVAPADKRALFDYLQQLQAIQVAKLSRAEQMAYWVNLYNALTVKVILDHYPVESIRDIDISPGWFSNDPWDAKLLTIEGREPMSFFRPRLAFAAIPPSSGASDGFSAFAGFGEGSCPQKSG